MAFSGVRSSWLMVARKRDFATLAPSACWRAASEIDFSSSNSAINASFSARNSSIDNDVEFKPLARKMKYTCKPNAMKASAMWKASAW